MCDVKPIIIYSAKPYLLRLIFYFFLYPTIAISQGNLDTSFGDSGKLIFGEDDYREVRAIEKNTIDDNYFLLQNSSKNTSNGNDIDFLLTKFNAAGELDVSFGVNGTLKADFKGFDISNASDFVVTKDGSLFIYGYASYFSNTYERFSVLTKLTPTGEVDDAFANSGVKQIKYLGYYDQPEAIMLDHRERLLLAGGSRDSTEGHGQLPVIARYFQDGTPDKTFGENGKIKVDFNGEVVSITNTKKLHALGGLFYDIAEDEHHNIYAVGSSLNLTNKAFMLKLNEDGSPDSTFLDNGRMYWDSGSGHETWMRNVTVLSSGEVAVALNTDDAENDFTMGLLKGESFKTYSFDVNDGQDFLEKIVEEKNGDLILAGRTIPYEKMNAAVYSYQFSALKVSKEGTLDNSFSEDGKFELEIVEGGQEGCNVALVTENNNLLLAGKVFSEDLSAIYSGMIKVNIDKQIVDNGGLTDKSLLDIFPNPSNGIINLNWDAKNLPNRVEVKDVSGKAVLNFMPEKPEEVLNMSTYSSGVYFIVVYIEGSQKVYKLLKF